MAATTARYFATINGKPEELTGVHYVDMRKAPEYVGLPLPAPGRGNRVRDCNTLAVGSDRDGFRRYASRVIFYKRNASKHKCSAKCRSGKPGGVCECSCGGANHGAG